MPSEYVTDPQWYICSQDEPDKDERGGVLLSSSDCSRTSWLQSSACRPPKHLKVALAIEGLMEKTIQSKRNSINQKFNSYTSSNQNFDWEVETCRRQQALENFVLRWWSCRDVSAHYYLPLGGNRSLLGEGHVPGNLNLGLMHKSLVFHPIVQHHSTCVVPLHNIRRFRGGCRTRLPLLRGDGCWGLR